jgi:uncharacterized membrane protein
MDQRNIHRAFQISVLLKGAHALIECIGGVLLAVVNTDSITRFGDALTQGRLREHANDVVATYMQSLAHTFSVSTQHFYAFYLFSHGVVNLCLVVGLLRGKLWAYPTSLAVLGLFIVYQLYRYSHTHGVGLIVLTVFDIIVIGLIWHEYRVRLRFRAAGGPR